MPPPEEAGGAATSVPAAVGVSTSNVFRNAMTLATGEVGARLIAFVATSYLARQLGPSAFGILGFATAIAGYPAIAVRAGFDEIGTREVALEPAEAPTIALSVIAVRVLAAVLLLAGLGLLCLILPKPPAVKIVVFFTGLSFLSLAVDTSWTFKGLERSRTAAIGAMSAQAIFAVAALALIRGPHQVAIVPLIQFAGELAAAGMLACALFKSGRARVSFERGMSILRASGFILVTKLLRTIIFSFDVVLLGFLVEDREVGLYTAAYRVCFLLLAVNAAVSVAYLPVFARAARLGSTAMNELLKTAPALTAAIGAPLVAGCIMTARPLLAALFGSSYVEGAQALQWLVVSIGFVVLHGVLHNVFVVWGRTRLEAKLMAVAAGVNIAGNVLLIPHYGIRGAAFTTALSEAAVVLMGFIAIARMGLVVSFRPVVRPVLAALAMSAALAAMGRERPFAMQVVVGALVYGTTLAIVKGIPHEMRASFGSLGVALGVSRTDHV